MDEAQVESLLSKSMPMMGTNSRRRSAVRKPRRAKHLELFRPSHILAVLSRQTHQAYSVTMHLDAFPPRTKNDRQSAGRCSNSHFDFRLAASLFNFGSALADLKFRVALANHVNATTAFDDLAVGVTVF